MLQEVGEYSTSPVRNMVEDAVVCFFLSISNAINRKRVREVMGKKKSFITQPCSCQNGQNNELMTGPKMCGLMSKRVSVN